MALKRGSIPREGGAPDRLEDAAVNLELLGSEVPFALQVEITSRCNLRCKMCPVTSGSTASRTAPGDIGELVWAEVIKAARRSRQVFLAGFGEPLTSPRCVELLRDLDEQAVRTTLVTNGLALSPTIAAQLAALEHLVHINVSIDSPDADRYREIRGRRLDRALDGLRDLMAAMVAVGKHDRVSVSSVAMQSNIETLGEFPALLSELGVRHYIVQGLVEYNDYAGQQRLLGRARLREELDHLRVECEAHGVDLDITTSERLSIEGQDADRAWADFFRGPNGTEHDTRQCLLPWELPYIDKDGKVFTCCYAASADEEPLGQLGPATLEDVWSGQAYEVFRRSLLDGRSTPAICRSCTGARLGPHPLREYRAVLVLGSLRVTANGWVSVQVRNLGTRTWTNHDEIFVGTTLPRDGPSLLAHPSWIRADRACCFSEDHVVPGAVATFEYLIDPPRGGATQNFQIVVEHVCWLPNTQFTVDVSVRAGRVSGLLLKSGGRHLLLRLPPTLRFMLKRKLAPVKLRR
jgi:MoaA/NifB/PqqE/SkfB family radical SAM enzyme